MKNLNDILETEGLNDKKTGTTLPIGLSDNNKLVFADLKKTGSILMAGATGSGKSTFLHAAIYSLIKQNQPKDLQMIMIDPKKVDLTIYNKLQYLKFPVITDPGEAVSPLRWCQKQMEDRLNGIVKNKKPAIIILIDELADLMHTHHEFFSLCLSEIATKGKKVNVFIIASTSRPEPDKVITLKLKQAFTTCIAFAAASVNDSKTIIDQPGAEKLKGKGDMLLKMDKTIQRLQGLNISENEIAEHLESRLTNKPKILFINDEPFLGELFSTKLNESGFDCKYYQQIPNNPEEIINFVLAENPDLIITDIIMGGIDGFSFTKILKADDRTKKFPVLGFDNLGREREWKNIKDAGMIDYIETSKQMPHEFVEMVREYLNK